MPEAIEQVISGCIKGERYAQAALYHMYAAKMMGVCMWYSKNKGEAEEILQDGFMLIFTHIKSFNGDGSFEGWMRKIMVNVALAKHRSKKQNFMRAVIEYDADLHDTGYTSSVSSYLEEKELLTMVQELSPMYRLVFNLYVFEGLKHREIAEQLGITEGTSKSNLANARIILQRRINEQEKKLSSK